MHLLLLYGVGNMSNHSGSSVMKPFVLNLIEDRENQQNRWGGQHEVRDISRYLFLHGCYYVQRMARKPSES